MPQQTRVLTHSFASTAARDSVQIGRPHFFNGGLWSSGDIRDTSPRFSSFDLHLDGKTDTAACSEIIAHSGL